MGQQNDEKYRFSKCDDPKPQVYLGIVTGVDTFTKPACERM
jgi:hypothetical protein